jgi:hypothetical protein
MATEWTEAPATVIDIAKEIIRDHHPSLEEARIGFLFRDIAPVSGGQATWGQASKVSPKLRPFMDLDFIIWLAKDIWITLVDYQQRALIDHELCHCYLDMDASAKIRGHDVEEFVEIVKRHGFWRSSLLILEKMAIAQNNDLAEEGRRAAQLRLEGLPARGEVVSLNAGQIGKIASAMKVSEEDSAYPPFAGPQDVLWNEALKWAKENPGPIQISQLQRHFKIGYPRAARLQEALTQLEEKETNANNSAH